MNELVIDRQNAGQQSWLEIGERLVNTPDEEGGWSSYFNGVTESGFDLTIKDPQIRAATACLMENCKQWIGRKCRPRYVNGRMVIDEATRSSTVGGFSDYLFPIIRAAFPQNPINELISVQPTTRRTATIIYWNYMIGTTKGQYVKGQRIFDANIGRQDSGYTYSSETILGETVAGTSSTANTNTTLTGTLAFVTGGGIRANTVQLTTNMSTAGNGVVYYDTGNGGFTSPGITISASSINYLTGAFTITISGDTWANANVTATYEWDSEGSWDIPQMDVQITTSTAATQRRAMRLNYSIESMQDVMAEIGVSLEPNLIQATTEEMNYEIARQIIHELWINAPTVATFPITGPVNISQQQYFGDIVYVLNRASNSIWERTQKAYANWAIVDSGAATVIQSLPNNLFVKAPNVGAVQGLHYIGTLDGTWRIYKDLLLKNEPLASAFGNILMGYKGNDFWEAGFVWAPYQLLYTTDSIPTPAFTVNKGLATRYATKMVNSNMYCKIALSQ